MAKSSIPTHHRVALSVKEVAELIGMNKPTLYQYVNSGQLPSLKVGRRRLIRREALEKFLKDLENLQTEALKD